VLPYGQFRARKTRARFNLIDANLQSRKRDTKRAKWSATLWSTPSQARLRGKGFKTFFEGKQRWPGAEKMANLRNRKAGASQAAE